MEYLSKFYFYSFAKNSVARVLQYWMVIMWNPLFVCSLDLGGGSFLVQNLKSYKMKDRLRGSAKGAINAFTTGHCKKGNYSLVLIQRAMIISVQDTKCCFKQGNYYYEMPNG